MKTKNLPRNTRNSPGAARGANREIPLPTPKFSGLRFTKGGIVAISILIFLICSKMFAVTNYVWQGSPAPVPPFTNWNTAALTIQEAVDSSNPGDLVLVTNGIYASGATPTSGSLVSNRVLISKAINVKSVNGPDVTIIAGESCNGTNGAGAVRGVYLENGGQITGFTVSNGHTHIIGDWLDNRSGGGAAIFTSGTISECVFINNSAHNYGGGVFGYDNSLISDSMFNNNSARYGGGVNVMYDGIIRSCQFFGNSAIRGGGVYLFTDCIAEWCYAEGNVAYDGGGIYCQEGTSQWCVVVNNTATNGGGIFSYRDSLMRNCFVFNNSAYNAGGGVMCWQGCEVESCTVVQNYSDSVGGVYILNYAGTTCIVENTIAYFNGNGNMTTNPVSTFFSHCCTYPIVAGTGIITNDPEFLNPGRENFHLSPDSLCRNAGLNKAWQFSAIDLDDTDRIEAGTVDIGAYEIGRLICSFDAEPLYGFAPLQVQFNGMISGTNTADVFFFWDFQNDGTQDLSGAWLDAPQFVYSNYRIYSVALVVSNSLGETSRDEEPGYIDVVPEGGIMLLTLSASLWLLRNRH